MNDTGKLNIEMGVSAAKQESSFGNATSQEVSPTRTMSVAVTLPEGAAALDGVDLDDEAQVRRWLSIMFATSLAGGCAVDVQIGPTEEGEEED